VDTSIFDVDNPIILDDGDTRALWDRHPPAALLVAALSRPGLRVLQVGDDRPELIVLAALLGAEAKFTTGAVGVTDIAMLNAVNVQPVSPGFGGLNLVIVNNAPIPPGSAGAVVLCNGSADASDSRVRVDVIASEVVVSTSAPPSAAHLLVPADRLEEVVTRTKHAAYAFSERQPNRWASQALESSMRLADKHRVASVERDARATEEVRRAQAQMRQAREELRAVRHSRSWRYTRFLRQLSGP